MEKTFISLLAALLILGCTRDARPDKTQLVTFNIGNVQTGDIATKAGITALLTASAPATADVTLTLVSKTNSRRTYKVKPGEAVAVALDTYRAYVWHTPASVGECFHGTIHHTPAFYIDTTLTIEDGVTSYTLPASYDCIALVWDKTTTAAYKVLNTSSTLAEVAWPWVTDGDLALVYVKTTGWSVSSPLVVLAQPVDDVGHEATQYKLATAGSSADVLLAEPGKWYTFHPGEVAATSGTLSFSLPEWTAGN